MCSEEESQSGLVAVEWPRAISDMSVYSFYTSFVTSSKLVPGNKDMLKKPFL